MKSRGLAVVGTASSVGKTFLTAILLYHFRRRGYSVTPFKVQNMSLNSYPALDGGEIALAQAMQAYVAGAELSSCINPVLLKPVGRYTEVIVRGKPIGILRFGEYWRSLKPLAWRAALECFDELSSRYDIVVVEGAGCVAEPNFVESDIANLRIAVEKNLPAILVADIERGGAFASIVGCLEILPPSMRERIKGFVINRFRGSIEILEPALRWLESRTGLPVLGVAPYVESARLWPEDSMNLEPFGEGSIDVALIAYPTAANLNDLEPLRYEDVTLRIVRSPKSLGDPDIVILPGARSVVSAIEFLRKTGLDKALEKVVGSSLVLGICGGHEILGKRISDPHGFECGSSTHVEGLNMMDYEIVIEKDKVVAHTIIESVIEGIGRVRGYEIHRGRTIYGRVTPFGIVVERNTRANRDLDGSVDETRGIYTTFLHDVLWNDSFRCFIFERALRRIRGKRASCRRGLDKIEKLVEAVDRIYRELEGYIDFDRIERIVDL